MNFLEPVDLDLHIRLGRDALLGSLDPTREYLPYWNCDFRDGDVAGFRHAGAWDRCHDVARVLHGLSMAEVATGESVPAEIRDQLAAHLFALFDGKDNLSGTPDDQTGKRFLHLHNIRETVHGLTALLRWGYAPAGNLARAMVRTVLQALDAEGRIHLDRLPPYVEAWNHQPSQEGRAVDALVRYYRASGDEAAVELASRMTRFALTHCFTPVGTLTEEAGTHGHSINALVAGMLDLALLLNDGELLRKAKAAYDVGLPRFNSSFGWSMESLNRYCQQGEANNTGDLLRAALLLGRAGFAEYYGHAERILRSHLLPSQVTDVEQYSSDPDAGDDAMRSVAARIRGGFGFPTPNDLLVAPDSPITVTDITSGAVDGMCEAWGAIITEDAAGVRINLLLSRETQGVRAHSALSGTGRVDIENASDRNLFVRIPAWVAAHEVALTIGGVRRDPVFVGPYALIPEKDRQISLQFPVSTRRTEESIAYVRYTIDWRGDQIVAMSPPAQHLPMFPPVE